MEQEVYGLLAKQFSSPQEVMTEIINLKAILNLPKGTEHFLSDLHGESETFLHILRNASGVIRTKIDLAFGDTLSKEEKNDLATLIYYPEQRMAKVKGTQDENGFYEKTPPAQIVPLNRSKQTGYGKVHPFEGA